MICTKNYFLGNFLFIDQNSCAGREIFAFVQKINVALGKVCVIGKQKSVTMNTAVKVKMNVTSCGVIFHIALDIIYFFSPVNNKF